MKSKFTGKLEIELGFTDKIMVARIHNLGSSEDYYLPTAKRLFSKVEIEFIYSKYDLEQPQVLEFKEIFRGEGKQYRDWLVSTILRQYLQYGVICSIELPFDEESDKEHISSFVDKHLQESEI